MSSFSIESALTHLRKHDPKLRVVIDNSPVFDRVPQTTPSACFNSLVRAIVYQQLSGKAAGTIYGRVQERFAKTFKPEHFHQAEQEELRSLGLSNAKALALKDLSTKVLSKDVQLKKLPTMSDSEAIEHLVQVRGIGPWSAQMFLMFTLVRPDILPLADLGIKKGAQKVYGLPALPDESVLLQLQSVHTWSPYSTVASWYLWRSLELDA